MKRKASPTPEQVRAALAMNALAHPRRMLLFDTLNAAPDGLRYSDLLERTGLSDATLTHHLRPMKSASLVDARRKGNAVIYRLRTGAVAPHLERVLAGRGRARAHVPPTGAEPAKAPSSATGASAALQDPAPL